MHLTTKRIERQIERADKLMRILWRLYSPYRSHRKLIVKSSAYIMETVELLEKLLEEVKKDYTNELKNPLPKKSIPPGHYKPEDSNEK